MKAYIILHNMIVEDERDDNEVVDLDYKQIDGVDNPLMQVLREQSDGFMSYIERYGRDSFSTSVGPHLTFMAIARLVVGTSFFIC